MKGVLKDITGQKFGRLLAIKYVGKTKSKIYWLFKCDCGSEKKIIKSSVVCGRTRSCGCMLKENKGAEKSANPMFKNPLNGIWRNMLDRCYNVNHISYKSYGARGITVCDRWLNLYNFCEDMGERLSLAHSIDRIDNSLGYFKENCTWATNKEQARNRRNNKVITVNGVSKLLCEWADEFGISSDTINKRIVVYGWSAVRAVTSDKTPRSRIGEENPKSKLKEDDVKGIFTSNEKYETLANKYKVGIATIQSIKNGVTWKYLTNGLIRGYSQKGRDKLKQK
jgi:hypothetical protein